MEFVVIDNNEKRLSSLTATLKEAFSGALVTQFTDPLLSAKFILSHPIDAVLAESEMLPVGGETLKDVLQINEPSLKVLIIADKSKGAFFTAKSDLVRPLTKEKLLSTLTL